MSTSDAPSTRRRSNWDRAPSPREQQRAQPPQGQTQVRQYRPYLGRRYDPTKDPSNPAFRGPYSRGRGAPFRTVSTRGSGAPDSRRGPSPHRRRHASPSPLPATSRPDKPETRSLSPANRRATLSRATDDGGAREGGGGDDEDGYDSDQSWSYKSRARREARRAVEVDDGHADDADRGSVLSHFTPGPPPGFSEACDVPSPVPCEAPRPAPSANTDAARAAPGARRAIVAVLLDGDGDEDDEEHAS